MNLRGRYLLLTATLLPVAAGCQDDSLSANPAPRIVADAGRADDGGADVQTDALPESDGSVQVKRTVIQRDPFGNYGVTDNLLMDGDFEWSGPFALQYPWFRLPILNSQDSRPDRAYGFSCHSGTRCALLRPNSGMAGVAVRPAKDKYKAHLSFWMRTTSLDSLASVHVSMAGCFDDANDEYELDLTEQQQPDGWRHVTAPVTFPDKDLNCLFVTVSPKAFQSVVVDQFALTPSDDSSTKALVRKPASASHVALVKAWQRGARKLLGPQPRHRLTPPPGLRNKIK